MQGLICHKTQVNKQKKKKMTLSELFVIHSNTIQQCANEGVKLKRVICVETL